MTTKEQTETRPHYHHGQLLTEGDFLNEQNYHLQARHRHNLELHGWGVVRGLEVVPESEDSVVVKPGLAIDGSGRDIALQVPVSLNLSKFHPNEAVSVRLIHTEEPADGVPPNNRSWKCYGQVVASGREEGGAGVLLAIVRLGDRREVDAESVDYSSTRYLRAVSELGTGWVRLPFRPIPIDKHNWPKDVKELLSFRVGMTGSLSPDRKEAGEQDRGAAGTMAIPLPPNARRVTRFRIAGAENGGEITVSLWRGGWDTEKKTHVKEPLLEERIKGAPFEETWSIRDGMIDPEYSTLSLWLRGTRRTAVSLVAVEFSYC